MEQQKKKDRGRKKRAIIRKGTDQSYKLKPFREKRVIVTEAQIR
jgi:hypothetical protein